jgi:hypothetical protein
MSDNLLVEDGDVNLIDLHPKEKKAMIVREDLGKNFEMAVCLLYGTPYEGNFKYNLLQAELIRDKISNLKLAFPHTLIHTAKNDARYNFIGGDSPDIKLSAKTNKKGYKICSQFIEQPSKKKFCEHFGMDTSSTNEQIKEYIQLNIAKLLTEYFEYTFSSPIVYYNEHRDSLWFIKNHKTIDFENYIIEFTHIEKNKIWNESSTVKVCGFEMGDFKVHNNKDNIKFRWNFDNLMYIFHHACEEEYFEHIDLHTLKKYY